MRSARRIGLVVLAALFGAATTAGQQPMPPAFPPINPANARLDRTLNGLDSPGVGIVASDATGLLLAACEGRSLHYWPPDLLLGVRASEEGDYRLRGHDGPILGIVAAGEVVATAGADGKILLWVPPQDKPTAVLDLKGPVRAVALSPDGKTVAGSGEDGTIQLWDTATGQPGPRIAASKDWQRALAFRPDGKALAAGDDDGKWRVFELPSGNKLVEADACPPPAKKEDPRETTVVATIAFAPDGKSLAVGGANGQVYQYQSDGKFLRALPGHTAGVSTVVFHPSGSLLVSAGKDRTLRLWNPANGQAVKTLEGHLSWVQGAAFYAQGTKLASVSADRTVRLWDLSDPKK